MKTFLKIKCSIKLYRNKKTNVNETNIAPIHMEILIYNGPVIVSYTQRRRKQTVFYLFVNI